MLFVPDHSANVEHVEDHSAGPARLGRVSFLLCLLISVLIFLSFNPFWKAVGIGDLDRGIGWSYGALPPLVALMLVLERKFGLASLFLESMKLVFTKFAVTYTLASVGWMLSGPPLPADDGAPAYRASQQEKAFAPVAAPPEWLPAPGQRGELRGQVVNPRGEALAGALVAVTGGLASYRFNPPKQAQELCCDESGTRPALALVQAYQMLLLRGAPAGLHTIQLTDEHGHSVLNHPCTAGSTRPMMFEHGMGMLNLSCRVHGASEPGALLFVTDNPFHVYSEADGSFVLEGVPSGALTLEAWSSEGGHTSASVALKPGGRRLDLHLQIRPGETP